MSGSQPKRESGNRREPWFAPTHWSVVLAAGQKDSPRKTEALETLCRTYWESIYSYLRQKGYEVHDAQDLTQAFFSHLLSRNALGSVGPQKGKFRSFLLASLQNFLSDERDRASAAKRGGGQNILSLDQEAVERRFLQEAVSDLTPEKAFDRRWALTLLDRAFTRLQEESVTDGAAELFNRLKHFLSSEPNPGDYETVGGQLRMSAGAVAVRVYRLRQRYRALVRAGIAQTVCSLAELEDEMRYLIKLICQ
jgi:DNA-directed RNA polymerase specialized sigma24 family protein